MCRAHGVAPMSRARRHTGYRRISFLSVWVALLVAVPALVFTTAVAIAPSAGAFPPALSQAQPQLHGDAGPSAGGIGSVLATLDLSTNQLFPGTANPAVTSYPDSAVYDPQNGRIYVRGSLGNDVSVVDPATHRDLANIPTPDDQQYYITIPSIAIDTVSGELFTTNANTANLSVINATTNTIVGSVYVGGSPYGIVFDPTNGELYVANFGGGNVTVVNAATERPVANLRAGTDPTAILFDPVSSEVFVANYLSNNVTVINTTSNLVVATLPVGTQPFAFALDTRDRYVDVLNEGSGTGNVTVLNPATNRVVTSVPVAAAPTAALYVAANDRLYVANAGSANVTVIAQSTNTAVGSVPTGAGAAADSLAYDPHTLDVAVTCHGSQNVTVFNTSSDRTVANFSTGNFPTAALYDPATSEFGVVNAGTYLLSANLTLLDGRTLGAVASVPLDVRPTGVAFDSGDGQMYVTDNAGNSTYWIDPTTNLVAGVASVGPQPTVLATPIVYASTSYRLFAIDPATTSVLALNAARQLLATIPVGLSPIDLAYDSVNGYVFVAQDLDGNLSVINSATDAVIGSLPIALDQNLRAVGVDTATNEVYVANFGAGNVTVFGATNFTKLATIPVGSEPSSVVYDPTNQTIFIGNYGSGNVSVISGATRRVVDSFTLSDPSAMTFDPATNALYNAEQFSNVVDAVNASTYLPLSGSPLRLGPLYYTSGIGYDPTSQLIYVTQADGDAVSIIGTSSVYPVTFTESGLPASTPWSVQFAGVTNASSAVTLGFREPNGSFGFTVGGVPGYTANVTSGTVTIDGAPRSVLVGFTLNATGPSSYPVSFNETGLPTGHWWNVTLAGSTRGGPTSSIQFTEPNGTYPFTVPAVPGFTPAPSSSSTTVQGRPDDVSVTFVANSSTFSVGLTATPAQITLGGSTTLAAVPSGGSAPFTFDYTTLPTGCMSLNRSSWSCTPTVTGSFTIGVVAVDAAGHRATASASLTVAAAPGNIGPHSASNGGSSTWTIVIVVAIIVGLVFLILFFWSRRRKRREASSGTASGVPPTPALATGGAVGPPSGGGAPPPE
jgi:YVTN family beta-propeller protein